MTSQGHLLLGRQVYRTSAIELKAACVRHAIAEIMPQRLQACDHAQGLWPYREVLRSD
jgi:hypothetical protein